MDFNNPFYGFGQQPAFSQSQPQFQSQFQPLSFQSGNYAHPRQSHQQQQQQQRPYPHLPRNSQLPSRPQSHSQSHTKPQSAPRSRSRSRSKERGSGRDAISAPSLESGGVPEPSSSYLLRASFLARTLPQPRPMLVVIDLNGTMLFRPNRKNPTKFVERPHARMFLRYCIETFHVVIWSSARPDNVRQMCASLLNSSSSSSSSSSHRYSLRSDTTLPANVVAIWGRDKFGLSPADYNQRTQCYKRLTRLWSDPVVQSAHPYGEEWSQGNTVLIDDSIEKARSEPYNAITLPEFLGDTAENPEVLPLVHDYLNTLAYQADISTYIRTHPFNVNDAAPPTLPQ
ncbi:hypothetical protein QBC46DRAFT_407886 [Diplogelasinospora grovesii]|uniref:Mitochondrial import inner membrane translocase subunit TIM50 n=1 Tax=Diplogelasinospora grovesii TaxID=303347 RepID=A0AAN6N9C2_9PEZI|nr:hypothetical protein QBC46DRAFT_407886 [Diplogelasinospora grovesii]